LCRQQISNGTTIAIPVSAASSFGEHFMYRTTNFFAGMILLAISPVALSQEPQLASPQVPEDALATEQLIAWSRMQKPQPAPQPLPPQDTPVPQPGQDQDQQAKPPADPQTQQSPTSQSFTGKIVKDAGKYVLQVNGSTTYQLDDQADIQQYENQTVKVVGNVKAGGNTIRVVKIELIS
jgi:hypothetical protein